ncbi:helix-turn-helix domain-containing protein [Chitinimonas sp.]|uniref:helix-turn-helix domain-containing protein n=1 Tax=Chitinimonas sp. TaxID=1934313 RepID=UPI0035B39E0D
MENSLDTLIAKRLKALRAERAWSLDELAQRSGVSRATLSRLENAEVSASASVLGKLCVSYGITLSRLMQQVESQFEPLLRAAQQVEWLDPDTGFRRRSVSPPAIGLAGEAIQGELPAGATIAYEGSPRPGLEHHLIMLAGSLELTVAGKTYQLAAGDCLRYQLHGPSRYQAGAAGALYYLFLV